MSSVVIRGIKFGQKMPKLHDDPNGLVQDIMNLLHVDGMEHMVVLAARQLEYKLMHLGRIERMIERMIELTLLSDKCPVDMLFEYSMQYHGIRRMLVRMGVLDKDTKYDLDDLGLLYVGVYA